jgi:hypothetical protein
MAGSRNTFLNLGRIFAGFCTNRLMSQNSAKDPFGFSFPFAAFPALKNRSKTVFYIFSRTVFISGKLDTDSNSR